MQIQCVLCWFVVILAVMAPTTTAKPDPDQLVAMADAVKILQNLDKYYSQVARPRFGKRGGDMQTGQEEPSLTDSGSSNLWRIVQRR